jgi:hypothetical protein
MSEKPKKLFYVTLLSLPILVAFILTVINYTESQKLDSECDPANVETVKNTSLGMLVVILLISIVAGSSLFMYWRS